MLLDLNLLITHFICDRFFKNENDLMKLWSELEFFSPLCFDSSFSVNFLSETVAGLVSDFLILADTRNLSSLSLEVSGLTGEILLMLCEGELAHNSDSI